MTQSSGKPIRVQVSGKASRPLKQNDSCSKCGYQYILFTDFFSSTLRDTLHKHNSLLSFIAPENHCVYAKLSTLQIWYKWTKMKCFMGLRKQCKSKLGVEFGQQYNYCSQQYMLTSSHSAKYFALPSLLHSLVFLTLAPPSLRWG